MEGEPSYDGASRLGPYVVTRISERTPHLNGRDFSIKRIGAGLTQDRISRCRNMKGTWLSWLDRR